MLVVLRGQRLVPAEHPQLRVDPVDALLGRYSALAAP
jgi:hypothetical protein